MLESIIEKCKQNNRRAQMQLYNKYCNAMFNVAARYLKDTAEAEDAVQEAFINAFKKLESYKGEVAFGAWLKRIVINKSLDCLKLKKAQFTSLDNGHSEDIISHNNEGEWMANDTTITDVTHAISKMPDNYKYVVMLYLIEGYDHQEISDILGITPIASRTLLMRGKKKLKALLIKDKNGERYKKFI
jgi:RNA polymerase sigma-70 factor (ECF subfamily)